MYNAYAGGCNILNLQVSHHKCIDVKTNNNKSWDFTNPLLPISESAPAGGAISSSSQQQQQQHHHHHRLDAGYQSMSSNDISLMSGGAGQGQNLQQQLVGKTGVDHPLLPMPMAMNSATPNTSHLNQATAAFNTFSNQFLQQQQQQQQHHHHPHQQQQQHHHLMQQHQQQQQQLHGFSMGPGAMHAHLGPNGIPYTAQAAQSVTGYPIQSMDARSAVVQVSNFPDQVNTKIVAVNQNRCFRD